MCFRYAADVLEIAVDQWNHAVKELRPRVEDPQTLLPMLEARMEPDGGSLDQKFEAIQKDLLGTLVTVRLKTTDGNLLNLGVFFRSSFELVW